MCVHAGARELNNEKYNRFQSWRVLRGARRSKPQFSRCTTSRVHSHCSGRCAALNTVPKRSRSHPLLRLSAWHHRESAARRQSRLASKEVAIVAWLATGSPFSAPVVAVSKLASIRAARAVALRSIRHRLPVRAPGFLIATRCLTGGRLRTDH